MLKRNKNKLYLTSNCKGLLLHSLHKYQIVSLWDMKVICGYRMVHAIKELEYYAVKCATASEDNFNLRSGAYQAIKEARSVCEEAGLAYSFQESTDRLSNTNAGIQQLSVYLKALGETIERECRSHQFMALSPDLSKSYQDKMPFGQSVFDRLVKSREDFEEGSKCFALGRYTACIFHLMRGIEDPLDQFATILIKSYDPKVHPNWGDKLRVIQDELTDRQKLSKSDPRQREYEELHASIKAVKNVWRDSTMHLEKTYTEDAARQIFSDVRGLLHRIVKVL